MRKLRPYWLFPFVAFMKRGPTAKFGRTAILGGTVIHAEALCPAEKALSHCRHPVLDTGFGLSAGGRKQAKPRIKCGVTFVL